MEAQATQLIADGALRDLIWIAAGQAGKVGAQVGGTKAVCEQAERHDGVEQRMGARIGKAQTRGAQMAGRHRAVDGLEGIFGQHAVVTEAFDIKQRPIGRKADLAQLLEILQALADAEVIGIVDGGFGAQRPGLLCGTA